MSYISLIRAFHKLNECGSISCYAASLYFMLVEECNLGHWENPFTVETRHIEHRLGISRPTICKARKELEALGLLQFEDGKNGNQASIYTLSNVSAANTDRKCDLHYTTKKKRVSVNVTNSNVSAANTDTLLYNKDNKTKLSNDNLSPAVADDLTKRKNKRGKKVEEKPATIGPESKPKAAVKKTKAPPAIVTRAREIFESYYLKEYGVAYYWEAKDAVNMKGLLNKISHSRKSRDNPLPVDDDSLLNALLELLKSINKAWIKDNFSVSKINCYYNDIVSEIRNRLRLTVNRSARPQKDMVSVNYDEDDFGSIDK